MFGNGRWKNDVVESLRELELSIADLRKADSDIRAQNARLLQILKNVGKKLATRLPISIDSLEKGLDYDLIFPEEVDAWIASVAHGVVLDTRSIQDHAKGSIPGSYNIPFEQLAVRSESLGKDIPVLLVCENGVKSVAACELLQSKGYSFLYVLKGGMSLYQGRVHAPVHSEDAETLTDLVQ